MIPFWPRPVRHGAAGPADAPAMAGLHRTAFPRGWSAEELALLLSEPGAAACAVRRGDALLGFALGRTAADEAEILSLVVETRARRRGLGAALLAALETACFEAGARAIFLEVSEANEAAQALYAAAGYREVGRRPRYYEDGAGALTMRKPL